MNEMEINSMTNDQKELNALCHALSTEQLRASNNELTTSVYRKATSIIRGVLDLADHFHPMDDTSKVLVKLSKIKEILNERN